MSSVAHSIKMEERLLCVVALRVCHAQRETLGMKKETADAMMKLSKRLDPDSALSWAISAVTATN
jgi:hypothetical protein